MKAAKKAAEKDVGLPFPALQLLAPPVRLVSAAVWKTVTRRDTLQYGAVEEFVTAVCDSVPGLLTFRHQGKLTLGLRGRLILELLFRSQDQPDRESIHRHLERFRAPAASSSAGRKKDVKIERTVSSFQELVDTLLRDPEERLQFFKEEFPEEYGSKFDQELEKLLWEFLLRIDQLLPVPNLAQTVSWLSTAPPVLEECARAASQPQLLKTILQHQTCLGHLESAASLPPKMGDSILTSLSIPLSGRPPSTAPPSTDRSSSLRRRATESKAAFVAPVFGLISNEDVPAMISAGKKKAKEGEEGRSERSGAKRKQPDDSEEGVEEEEEEVAAGRGASRRGGRRSLKKRRGENGRRGSGDPDPGGPPILGASSAADPSLRAAFSSCLLNQPKVLLRRLDRALLGAAAADGEQGEGAAACAKKAADKKAADKNQRKRATEPPGVDDKENSHVLPGITSPPTIPEDPAPGGSDDIIGDSEDEATENLKGRLFRQRYYKTKHDTYVPTLREFWKPWMSRTSVLSPR